MGIPHMLEYNLEYIDSHRQPWMGCMFVMKQNIQAVREKLTELYFSSSCQQLGIDYPIFVDRLIPYYTVDPNVLDKLYLDTKTVRLIESLVKKGSVTHHG